MPGTVCCFSFLFGFFSFCSNGGLCVLTWAKTPRSMVVFDMGGSGPAAARVESARTATERRMMMMFDGALCGREL